MKSINKCSGQEGLALAKERGETVDHGTHFRAMAFVSMSDKPDFLLDFTHSVVGAD